MVHLVLKCPLALADDQAEDFDLTLSVLIAVPGRLPIAWDALEHDCLVAGHLFRYIFEYRYEHCEQSHVFTRLVDDVLTHMDGFLGPIISNISKQEVTGALIDCRFLSEPERQKLVLDAQFAHELDENAC